tara:strand:- start:1323 stop:1559 length:237 start_codon:yes stop_codon:yes gene_type:complete
MMPLRYRVVGFTVSGMSKRMAAIKQIKAKITYGAASSDSILNAALIEITNKTNELADNSQRRMCRLFLIKENSLFYGE